MDFLRAMLYPRKKKMVSYFQDIQEKKSIIIKKLTSKYKGQKQTGINILKRVVDICSDNIETLQFKKWENTGDSILSEY